MPSLAFKLLAWYDQQHRSFPWRAPPEQLQCAYVVWLSEIMLQQTTTTTVQPYFCRFIEKWPTIEHLAAAHLDEIFQMWQGLGYYARARNLHRCAQAIVQEYQGRFPETVEALQCLPGIGPYTAAAIAAIAFGVRSTAVDGNIIRVFCRLKAITIPVPLNKNVVALEAAAYVPAIRPGDYTQGLMDLGATICTPRNPLCALCPLQKDCAAFAQGRPTDFPVKAPPKVTPDRYTTAFVLRDANGAIFLQKRPDKGLLAGLYEVPNLPWALELHDPDLPHPCPSLCERLPLPVAQLFQSAVWQRLPQKVVHTFTHLRLHVQVCVATHKGTGFASQESGVWCREDQLDSIALPTLMKKVLAIGRPDAPWD